ncbi:MAG: CHASE2 domain-containing protein [Parahaliea sp.]
MQVSHVLRRQLLLGLLAALVCCLIDRFNWSAPLDRGAYDFLISGTLLPPPADVLLVAIDDQSLAELGRWPWPRERHVDFLRRVTQAGAAVVAMDIIFADRDAEYPQADELLADAVREHGHVVLPVYFDRLGPGLGQREVLPMVPLRNTASVLGHVHVDVEADGAVRGIYTNEGVGRHLWPHFALVVQGLVENRLGTNKFFDPLPDMLGPSELSRRHYVRVPLMGPAETVRQISYADIVKGRIEPQLLADKVLFVGATSAGLGDSIATPLGRMSGIEFNINIYNASRRGELISLVHGPLSLIVSFGLSFLLFVVITSLPSRGQLLALCSALLILLLAALMLIRLSALWYSPVSVMLALMLFYPVWSWMRLSSALQLIESQLKVVDRHHMPRQDNSFWGGLGRRADLLQRAGYVDNWRLEPELMPRISNAIDQRWEHYGKQSWRVFQAQGRAQRLRLVWHDEELRPLRAMQSLFQIDADDWRDSAEGIDATVAHFRQSFERAREFRELVDGSIENMTAGVLIADISGELLFANSEARNLLPMDSVGNEDIHSVFALFRQIEPADDENLTRLLQELALNNIAFEMEGRIDGPTERDVLLRGRSIDLAMPTMIFVLADTTEIKQSERSRIEALNFLSHDLRAPLNSVLTLIEAAPVTEVVPEQAELLSRIDGYVRTTLGYAENFVHLSRLKHRPHIGMEACEAQSIVDDALSLLVGRAEQKGIELVLDYPQEEIWLHCNRSLLERACLNLVDNAIKYSDGGVVTLTLSEDAGAGIGVIRVGDQGAGIDASRMASVFKLFEQGETPRGGVGLGLRFVAAVAELHEGAITLDSEPGKGTVFTLRIPLSVVPDVV